MLHAKKNVFILLLLMVVMVGCVEQPKLSSMNNNKSTHQLKPKQLLELPEPKPTLPAQEPSKDGIITVSNPTSIEVLLNKQRKLPDGYVPEDLVVPNVPFYFDEYLPKKQMRQEAATALEQLFHASNEQAGLNLVAASGYRSYATQKQIYENNVRTKGEEHANQFSAKPGTSEHQTGLAMDVTTADVGFSLVQSFKETEEGTWLAEHAHEYGFIIRYLEGKTDITGYAYEPWHLRYVGTEMATDIYEQSLTLEEFFGIVPNEN